MNQLSIPENNNIKVTSLEIAQWTSKEHGHVMRDIKREIEELGEIGQSIFGLTSYIDTFNRKQPCYTMNQDGVMQLALKYDAISRYKCIQKLKELESNQILKPKSIEDLIIMQAQSVKELKEKVNILEEKQNKLEAKLITRQEDFFSVAGYCSLNGIKKTSTDYIGYGKKCVALSKKLGITIGTVPDAKHGKVNIYHIDVLKSIIEG